MSYNGFIIMETAMVSKHNVQKNLGEDSMNLDAGEYIMDMGGGDKINLDTGEYIMDLD